MQRNPFRGVIDVFGEMNRMRQLGRTGHESGPEGEERTHATAWVPATDVFARGADLVIQAELAGLKPEDVDVTLSHGILTISGLRREGGTGAEDVSFYSQERFRGAFRRIITLPEGTREDDISAAFEDGLVEIVVRGACSASVPEPRRIRLREGLG